MEKQSLQPNDLLQIASQHAYCAQHLLNQRAEIKIDNQLTVDVLLPITSLMYQAFELMLKAFLLYDLRQINQYKNLLELIELNTNIDLSKQELQLIQTLSRQQAFRKGLHYDLWENRQQQHIFCEEILNLFVKLQDQMPVELQNDYQSF